MPGTNITGSPNIAVLDSKIVFDLADGKIRIDATPSTFIGGGASNILGIKVRVTSPYKVVVKDYGGSYDIPAPATAVYEMDIPTLASKYQYGVYKIDVELTDAGGTTYTVSKSINVCQYADSDADCRDAVQMDSNCLEGKLHIRVASAFAYQGKLPETEEHSWTVVYPSGTLNNEVYPIGNFAVRLFEGVYKLDGFMVSTYNMGDNIYILVPMQGKWEKNVKCAIDYSCIEPKLQALHKKLSSKCSQKEIAETTNKIIEILWLLRAIEITLASGKDADKFISDLEEILDCTCTCKCAIGTPIIANDPASLIVIQGCGFEVETVGITKIYTFNNYEYVVEAAPGQSILTVSAASLTDCTKKQSIGFNIQAAYSAVKGIASADAAWWAGLVNGTLVDINPVCLGITQEVWNAYTLKQKFEILVSKACAGGNCSAEISNVTHERVGSSVQLTFTVTNAHSVDLYVDGVWVGKVLGTINTLTVPNVTDGLTHTYLFVPLCSNGSIGTPVTGTFKYIGCPAITPPVLSETNVTDADCPYDLTALLGAPPAGIEYEWHNANNTNSHSLVPDPENVAGGVFYVFAKDVNGCYSSASTVTVICADGSCTAPQSLVVSLDETGFLIEFQSAQNPPPGNSYTVKRKLAADPDIDASYTTLGAAIWNAGTNRWEYTDTTASTNVLYTYKAQSNCGGTTPYVLYNFGNLTCPILTFDQNLTSIDYEFTHVGGGVNKYEVSLLDASGHTLIAKNTHIPAFSNPVSGTFPYTEAGTLYKVRVRVFIDAFYEDCPDQSVTGLAYTVRIDSTMGGMTLTNVSGIAGYTLSAPMNPGGVENDVHDGFSTAISLTLTGTPGVNPSNVNLSKNGVLLECIEVTAAGTFAFAAVAFGVNDLVTIHLSTGGCGA